MDVKRFPLSGLRWVHRTLRHGICEKLRRYLHRADPPLEGARSLRQPAPFRTASSLTETFFAMAHHLILKGEGDAQGIPVDHPLQFSEEPAILLNGPVAHTVSPRTREKPID